MKYHLSKIQFISLLLVLILTGCSSPRYGFLPKPSEFRYHSRGMIAEGKLLKEKESKSKSASWSSNAQDFRGEMIALRNDTLWLLKMGYGWDGDSTRLLAVTKEKVQYMTILLATSAEDPHSSDGLALANFILPLSHGWFMIFSYPLNLVVNLPAVQGSRNGVYRMNVGEKGLLWSELYKFCRFPQGMPEGIPWSALE